MIRIISSLVIVLISGCVAFPDTETSLKRMYNVSSSGTSKFDNSKHIRISNMRCDNIMFELYQDTEKKKNNIVLLKAGSVSVENIGKGKSLHIKLDGEVYSFKSNDPLTEHDTIYLDYGVTMTFSHKSFVVSESFIRKAAASNEFLAKVELLNNTYIEGTCSPVSLKEAQEESKKYNVKVKQEHVDIGNKFAAINGFREFVKMSDHTKW